MTSRIESVRDGLIAMPRLLLCRFGVDSVAMARPRRVRAASFLSLSAGPGWAMRGALFVRASIWRAELIDYDKIPCNFHG